MIRALTAFALVAVLPVAPAAGQEDVKESPACRYCGMDRGKFAHGRMLVAYEDGSTVATCSLHCAAVELASAIDRTPREIRVADLATKELVDAEKASWVLGGQRPGVMTTRAKWAFADRTAAEAFVKENGGAIVSFDEAMKAAYEDMWRDVKAIREKRRAARAKAAGPEAAAQPVPAKH
jgi:copper chaperone NosL